MKKHISYQWVLFYIDNKYYNTINKELKSKGYKHIKAVVPTIKILKKRQKGRDIYEEVPILFNYGFMKMPTEKAFSRVFLNKLKKAIVGIHNFVKSTSTMHPRKKKARIDNAEDFDDFSIVATVDYKDVRRFRRLSKLNKVYTKDEIISIPIGSYVTLKGYPFEGISATVLDINPSTRKVKVLLYPEGEHITGGKIIANVSMDNVLYSIYQDYDESRLYANNTSDISSNLTEENINDFITSKTYI